MAGCLLLEEIDSPLEEEELEQIRKLLDPYAERIRRVLQENPSNAPEEEEMIDSERREARGNGLPQGRLRGQG